ncbi:MAG: arginine--tRNA ligase [bacterium]
MIESIVRNGLVAALERLGLFEGDVVINLEKPRERSHGDLSSNLAMMLAKRLRRKPRELAGELAAGLTLDRDIVESVEIAGAGFINFRLARPYQLRILLDIWHGEGAMAEIRSGAGKRINVEYISSNPTGPLNVVSARAGAFGSTLVRLLDAIGYDAHGEYYVNDAGGQIKLLGESLRAHYLQLRGEDEPLPEGGYLGRYLEIMAGELLEQDSRAIQAAATAFDDESFQRITAPEGNAEDWRQLPRDESVHCFAKYALMKILSWQRETCRRFGLRFDTWYFESELHETKRIERALDQLRKRDAVYELDGAVWFKSTDHGDEKDRVLVRSDGEPTYFLADIAYHYHKFQRGFEHAIDFLGPDHHGYIVRMQGAMEAIGAPKDWLEIQILQQVNFFEQGRPVDMSKRKGRFVTMDALCDEVGADVAKYIFLTRKPNSHLDFDLDLARTQSRENPVYYVKYAHARICTVLNHAVDAGIDPGEPDPEVLATLEQPAEWDLIRELIWLPQVVVSSAQTREPHHLTGFVSEVAKRFHKFYDNDQCKIISDDESTTRARLQLCLATRRVLAYVMELIGVDAPERMIEKE